MVSVHTRWVDGQWVFETQEAEAVYTLNRTEAEKPHTWWDGHCFTNLTRDWLFNANSENYLRVQRALANFAMREGYTRNYQDAEGWVTDYLCKLCKNNSLRGHLAQGKEIKNSVLTHWFKQHMSHTWQKIGLDADGRTVTGAKSQAEIKSGVNYTLLHEDMKEVVVKKNEKGQVVDVDQYDPQAPNEAETKLQEEQFRTVIYNALREDHDNYEHLYKVFLTELSDAYDSRAEWAREWGVQYHRLTADIVKVHDTIRELGADTFGW